MLITAEGRLRHHFWGDYAASIVVAFATKELAALALPHLPGFTPNRAHPYALNYHGTGPDLDATENRLVALGANRAKLTSLAKSIDYGEPFTIAVDLSPAGPAVEQLGLFSEGGA